MNRITHSRPVGKRAILSFNFPSMIPRILFLVLMLTACVILIRMFAASKLDTYDIQAEVLINGFIYSTGGIGYYDDMLKSPLHA